MDVPLKWPAGLYLLPCVCVCALPCVCVYVCVCVCALSCYGYVGVWGCGVHLCVTAPLLNLSVCAGVRYPQREYHKKKLSLPWLQLSVCVPVCVCVWFSVMCCFL